MSHAAAIIPEARTPLEVQVVKTAQPGPKEILIKNELIALIPIDAKQAKYGIFPIPYPSILGTSYGGTVTAVGADVTKFKVGDKVAAVKAGAAGILGDRFSSFQQYVLSLETTATKIPENVDISLPVGLIGNLTTVVAVFTEALGLTRPDPLGNAASQGKKVLVYGGTSSFGSLAVQYVSQAGYDVVTTTSPRHKDIVAKLGASHIVDHTQSPDAIIKELVAQGPYDYVVDSISLTETYEITAAVVASQGGNTVYGLLPPPEQSSVPSSVSIDYRPWSITLAEEKNAELLSWSFHTYLYEAVANNKLVGLNVQKIEGGLAGLNDAIDILVKGVSGAKVVLDPRE
ncbi:hypothetical protein EsH8_I_000546 [Colletotrichum jinshuiense]